MITLVCLGRALKLTMCTFKLKTTKLAEGQKAALNPSQTLVGVSLLLLDRSAVGVFLSLSA